MFKILAVSLGGAVGASLRYLVSYGAYRLLPKNFPWGTLIINLSGSFLIGLIWGMSEKISLSPHIKLFLIVGILGAFTTFSTFSLENFNLLKSGEYLSAFLNIFLSLLMGILMVFLGFGLSQGLKG